MTDPADDTIRCTPRSTAAEVRPAYFHGRTAVVSVAALALPPALVGYLVLVDFTGFVAVGVLISLFWAYLVLFAVPFDQAKAARPLEWTLTEQNLTFAAPGSTTTVDWTQFSCLVVGHRTLILHIGKGGPCLAIPRRCLTSEELSRLIRWTRGQGLTVRRTRLRPAKLSPHRMHRSLTGCTEGSPDAPKAGPAAERRP